MTRPHPGTASRPEIAALSDRGNCRSVERFAEPAWLVPCRPEGRRAVHWLQQGCLAAVRSALPGRKQQRTDPLSPSRNRTAEEQALAEVWARLLQGLGREYLS